MKPRGELVAQIKRAAEEATIAGLEAKTIEAIVGGGIYAAKRGLSDQITTRNPPNPSATVEP